MEKVIEVANVSKSFKTYERASSGFLASLRRHYYTKNALASVSFSINKGQIVALLGSNASGDAASTIQRVSQAVSMNQEHTLQPMVAEEAHTL